MQLLVELNEIAARTNNFPAKNGGECRATIAAAAVLLPASAVAAHQKTPFVGIETMRLADKRRRERRKRHTIVMRVHISANRRALDEKCGYRQRARAQRANRR